MKNYFELLGELRLIINSLSYYENRPWNEKEKEVFDSIEKLVQEKCVSESAHQTEFYKKDSSWSAGEINSNTDVSDFQNGDLLLSFAAHFKRSLQEGLYDPEYKSGENIVFDSLKNEFGTLFLKKIYKLISNKKEE